MWLIKWPVGHFINHMTGPSNISADSSNKKAFSFSPLRAACAVAMATLNFTLYFIFIWFIIECRISLTSCDRSSSHGLHFGFAGPYTSYCWTLTCCPHSYICVFVPPSGHKSTLQCKNQSKKSINSWSPVRSGPGSLIYCPNLTKFSNKLRHCLFT